VAAAKAAEGVRAAGGEGTAVVLTAEPELPYERPPLSKAFLRGEAGRDYVRTHDEVWYRDHQVELLLATRASTLDQATRTVTTEIVDQLRYGRGPAAGGDLPGREHGDHRRRLHRRRGGRQRHPDGHPGDPAGGGRHPVDQGGRLRDGPLLRGLPARPGRPRPHPDQGRAPRGRRQRRGGGAARRHPAARPRGRDRG